MKTIIEKLKSTFWDVQVTGDPALPSIGLHTPLLRRAWNRWGIAAARWLGLLIIGALILKLSGLS